PENSLSCPWAICGCVRCLSGHLTIGCMTRLIGWGGWIRTTEYGIQSPAPYRLATPQQGPRGHPQKSKSTGSAACGQPDRALTGRQRPDGPRPLLVLGAGQGAGDQGLCAVTGQR